MLLSLVYSSFSLNNLAFSSETLALTTKSLFLQHFSVNRFANHGFKSFEMLYRATQCDDNNLLNSFTDAFQTALGKMVG